MQPLLYRIDALCFGLDAALNDFGPVTDDNQRRLTGHFASYSDMIVAVAVEARAVCESIEVDARSLERGAR